MDYRDSLDSKKVSYITYLFQSLKINYLALPWLATAACFAAISSALPK